VRKKWRGFKGRKFFARAYSNKTSNGQNSLIRKILSKNFDTHYINSRERA
jgi:hypothetical protein